MSTQPRSLPRSPTQLKLFSGAAIPERTFPPGLSPESTLGQFYRDFVRPIVLRTAKPRNLEQYDESVGYWTDFTGDPPLVAIDDFTGSQFVAGVEALPGKTKGTKVSATTIHKHVRTVQRCLDLAGPRLRSNPRLRQAQHLIDEVPYIERPRLKRRKRTQGVFTLEEIAAQLQAAERMTVPRRLSPAERPIFWSSLVKFDYNVVLRIGSIGEMRWTWIHGEWLHVPGEHYKGGEDHVMWMNEHALAAVEAMRPITGAGERVFPFFEWYSQRTRIHEQHRKLLELAGLPKHRWFGFKGFRKRGISELARLDRKAAQLAGGHSIETTTDDFYILEEVDAELLSQTAARLPQPM